MINLTYTILAILCLCTGFYFGYKIADQKELPETNPIKVAEKVQNDVHEYKKNKENIKKDNQNKEKLNQLNDILTNINAYDGTGSNQKPIKK